MLIEVPDSTVIHATFHELCVDAMAAKVSAQYNANNAYICAVVMAHEKAMEAYKEAILSGTIYDFMARRN